MNMTRSSAHLPFVATLADVLLKVDASDLPPQTRKNLKSSISTMCRVLGRPATDIPGELSVLQPLLLHAAPCHVGVTMQRWGNVRTEVKRAIKLGQEEPQPRIELSPDWEATALQAQTPNDCSGVRTFGRFCQALGITPAEVDNGTLEHYRRHLEANRLSKMPERRIADLRRVWNRIATDTHDPALAVLTVPQNERNYTLTWEGLPSGLAEDAATFKQRSLSADWFEDDGNGRVVRPATAQQRDRMLRRLASAALLAGVPAASLNSLGELVDPTVLRPALEFMVSRAPGAVPNKQTFDMAHLALTIARHWANLSELEVATIAKWVRKFRPARVGMTEKNRERLRQVASADVITRLVSLPEQIFAELATIPVSHSAALEARRALMLALLTTAPVRLQNLRSLDRARHFRRSFSIAEGRWSLVIPSVEVKNHVDLEFPVPPHLVAMIDHYMDVYQPLLATGSACTALFPARGQGTSMSDGGVRTSLVAFIKRRLGLEINPHLFRHIAAMIFLKMNPGQYESVRQLLGHKNIQTTIDFYASFEADEAMQRFAGILSSYRDDPVPARKLSEGASQWSAT